MSMSVLQSGAASQRLLSAVLTGLKATHAGAAACLRSRLQNPRACPGQHMHMLHALPVRRRPASTPEDASLCQEGAAEVLLPDQHRRVLQAALLIARVHHPGGAGGVAVLARGQQRPKGQGGTAATHLHVPPHQYWPPFARPPWACSDCWKPQCSIHHWLAALAMQACRRQRACDTLDAGPAQHSSLVSMGAEGYRCGIAANCSAY